MSMLIPWIDEYEDSPCQNPWNIDYCIPHPVSLKCCEFWLMSTLSTLLLISILFIVHNCLRVKCVIAIECDGSDYQPNTVVTNSIVCTLPLSKRSVCISFPRFKHCNGINHIGSENSSMHYKHQYSIAWRNLLMWRVIVPTPSGSWQNRTSDVGSIEVKGAHLRPPFKMFWSPPNFVGLFFQSCWFQKQHFAVFGISMLLETHKTWLWAFCVCNFFWSSSLAGRSHSPVK